MLSVGWLGVVCTGIGAGPGRAEPREAAPAPAARLVAAYPDHLEAAHEGSIVWRDGTRMPWDDGRGPKTPAVRLARPDLEDMFHDPYPVGPLPLGAPLGPPRPAHDPGRVRVTAFFDKMYGDCRKGEVTPHLVDVPWLPAWGGGTLRVTRVNGVATRLARVSAELEQLDQRFRPFLVPAAGGHVCRVIAGTDRPSPHGWGIAVDIATRHADYWRWAPGGSKSPDGGWRNRIPVEIVRTFERHGFIWGGRWHHFDTMHFEYRPELAPPTR
jgi:hypothetical protein